MKLFRTYGLAAYWLIFAGYALYVGQFPGLLRPGVEWNYPWRQIAYVLVLLAVLVAILYGILRPKTYRRSWGRLIGACTYSALLFFVGFSAVVTDAPGYYYVPITFSVVTAAMILVLAIVTTGAAIVSTLRSAA